MREVHESSILNYELSSELVKEIASKVSDLGDELEHRKVVLANDNRFLVEFVDRTKILLDGSQGTPGLAYHWGGLRRDPAPHWVIQVQSEYPKNVQKVIVFHEIIEAALAWQCRSTKLPKEEHLGELHKAARGYEDEFRGQIGLTIEEEEMLLRILYEKKNV